MKIDVSRSSDIEYWAQRLGVKRARLIAAVAAAGPDVDRVEQWLHPARTPPPDDPRSDARRKIRFHSYD